MTVRRYGTSGTCVVLLHGGPGVPGYLAPVARRLADGFRVIEPFQRGSGPSALSVALHVADLHASLETHCGPSKPIVMGHSWGAMLALAHAAEHPGRSAGLVLVGCGTFDRQSRDKLNASLEQRTDAALRRQLQRLEETVPDPDRRLAAFGELTLPLYFHAPPLEPPRFVRCDARAYRQTWEDMLRLQDSGTYPAAFERIDVPVLMIHGRDDPHPGTEIRDSLSPHVANLEYLELARCGHYPWLEAHARDAFYADVRAWIQQRTDRAR